MNDIVSFSWAIFLTTFSWFWSALQVLFSVPFFGDLMKYAFWGGCIYLLYRIYRKIPQRIRGVAEKRFLPPIKWVTDPPRWYLAEKVAPGPFVRAGEAGTKIVEKEVLVEIPVPMRRSFRQWLMSGVRWGLFYVLAYATYANWASIWPYLSQQIR